METILLAKAGSLYDVGLQQMGLAIISEHLRAAAMVFTQATTPVYHREERNQMLRDSVAFVKGTGLHVVVEEFNLFNIDPDALQQSFFSWAAHRQQVHSSPSSSATIKVDSLIGA